MQIIEEQLPNFRTMKIVYDTIQKCVDEYCNLRGLKQSNFWIAGGSVRSAFVNDPVNDYDIFSPAPQLIKDALKSLENTEAHVTYEDSRVINFWHRDLKVKIQVILRFAPNDIEATFNTFDFTCVCGSFFEDKLYLHDRFLLDNVQKRLVLNSLHYPLSTLQRTYKYQKYGYRLCAKGMMQLAKAINEMQIDWNDPQSNVIEFYPDGTPRFSGVD